MEEKEVMSITVLKASMLILLQVLPTHLLSTSFYNTLNFIQLKPHNL